jgi:hypothetical protein
MKRRNPRFGCPRIAQQIAHASGVDIGKDVVRRILAQHFRRPSGSDGAYSSDREQSFHAMVNGAWRGSWRLHFYVRCSRSVKRACERQRERLWFLDFFINVRERSAA